MSQIKSIFANPEEQQIVLELTPLGVMLFAPPDGTIIYANPAAVRIVGQPLTGPSPMRAHPEQYGLRYMDGKPIPVEELPSWKAMHGKVVEGYELIVTRPDRTPVVISVSAYPLYRGNEIYGAVTYMQDVTAPKELDRLREEHLAVVAHDLRNPIQALLLNVASMLMRQERGAAQASATQLHSMQRTLDRLSGMINHLSDAALIGSSRVSLDMRRLELPAVISHLVESIRPTFGEHEVSVEVDGDLPPILGDTLRIEQIMTNLLENACKYSLPGSAVTVALRRESEGVLLTVADHGAGVAAEDMPWLFDRFYQAKRARAQKSGLGLGLYITRGLVEAHGGRIWVSSTPGQGSIFQVWFPAAPEPPATPEPEPAQAP